MAVVEVAAGSASLAEGAGGGQGSERPSGPTSVASCAPTGPRCSRRRELVGRGRSFFPSPGPGCVNPYPPFSVAVEPFSCDSLPSVSLSRDLPSVWMCVSPQQASSRWGKVDPSTPVCPALSGPPSQLFSGFSVSALPLAPTPPVLFVSGLPNFLSLWTPTCPLCLSGTPRQITPIGLYSPLSRSFLLQAPPSSLSVCLSQSEVLSPCPSAVLCLGSSTQLYASTCPH